MKAVAIAWMNLRRVFRDRTAIFFMFVFPFMIILAIGAVFGSGFVPVLGVVSDASGPLGIELVSKLERTDGLEVRPFDDREALVDAVERGEAEAGLVIPEGFDRAVRSGGTVDLPYIARPAGVGSEARLVVAAVIDEQSVALRAARVYETVELGTFDEGLIASRRLQGVVPPVKARTLTAGGGSVSGTFDYGAAQQLVLFVFVISLSASSMLIDSRRLGASRRMLASPTRVGAIVAGEALGRLAIALVQGLVIVLVTALLFGVEWGDPLATLAIVVAFSLVGTGAAMLLGSLLDNANQAGGMGVFIGLGFAALGGSMAPLEIFPEGVRVVAHATPHAWAMDAFGHVLGEDAGLGGIAPELGVLLAYAAVLLAVATFAFRRKLTSA